MTATNLLNPHPLEFERFLHASVGEDRNGTVVTVLSTLARLGLDPWTETADLVALGRQAGRARLELLLARVRDIPALGSDRMTVARNLSLLLPDSPRGLMPATPSAAGIRGLSVGAVLTILAILVVLSRMLFIGAGSGE